MGMRVSFDCHQKRYDEVRETLPNWVLMNQTPPLEIICGNSKGMKSVVEGICHHWGFTYRESVHNPAIIVIDRI